jgi:hypothetical protein
MGKKYDKKRKRIKNEKGWSFRFLLLEGEFKKSCSALFWEVNFNFLII